MSAPLVRMAVILLLLGARPAMAQAEAAAYNQANALFAKGEYAEAIKLYNSIQTHNPDLEHNRGATHLKLGSLGKATLHFKRALRMAPGDEDSRFNLRYIAGVKADREMEPEIGASEKIIEWILCIGSAQDVAWLALGLYLAAMGSAMGLILSGSARRGWMAALALLFICALAAGGLTWARMNRLHNPTEAVVMTAEAPVYQDPSSKGAPVFTLHEATIVRMGRVEGNYVFATLSSGHSGWMDRASLEKI